MFSKKCLPFMCSALAIILSPGVSASDIGFDVTQSFSADGIQIIVTPNENVRLGDQLVITDESGGDEPIFYAIRLKDADGDGMTDSVYFTIPQGSGHKMSIGIVPVDDSSGSVYCGVSGARWQTDVKGDLKEEIVFSDLPDVLTDETLCPNGLFSEVAGIRLEQGAIIAGSATKSSSRAMLSVFECLASSNDPLGSCVKHEVASGIGITSVSLDQVSSACSVLAQIIYADDRGRMITSDEEAIRMGGFCPSGYTGIGFSSGAHTLPGMWTTKVSIPKSAIKWVVDKVAKYIGKKVAKQTKEALSGCQVPKTLFWKLVNYLPTQIGWIIAQIITPCVVGG